jgi:hypothetical protein
VGLNIIRRQLLAQLMQAGIYYVVKQVLLVRSVFFKLKVVGPNQLVHEFKVLMVVQRGKVAW